MYATVLLCCTWVAWYYSKRTVISSSHSRAVFFIFHIRMACYPVLCVTGEMGILSMGYLGTMQHGSNASGRCTIPFTTSTGLASQHVVMLVKVTDPEYGHSCLMDCLKNQRVHLLKWLSKSSGINTKKWVICSVMYVKAKKVDRKLG